MIFLRLFFNFIKNEIKELINFINRTYIIFRDINVLNFIYSELFEKKKLDIFLNKYLNKYLLTNYKLNKKINTNENQSIFVEGFIAQPEYIIYNIIIAKKLSEIKKKNIVGLIRSGDIQTKKIFESYHVNKFISLDEGNLIKRFYYYFKSYKILKKVANYKSLLKLKYDGIDIGKCLYEQYLRFEKKPYVYTIEPVYYIYLMKLLIHNEQLKFIYKNQQDSFLVQSETQYFPLRVNLQRALLSKIKVLSRTGRKEIMIKFYKNFKSAYQSRNRVTPKIFNKLSKIISKRISKSNYKQVIKNKIKLNVGKDVYQQIKFNKKLKKQFSSLSEINQFFKFDNKPLVIILAHEFTDGNLAHSWNLYENDMLWLEDTIDRIKKIKNVNWIIKEHPSEKIYNAKISTKEIFNYKIKPTENIKLFPNEYKIDNFYRFVNAVVTSHGTAAYEYPLYSVPTIICGESTCSGNGFTIEPKTKTAYHKILKNIYNLKKLKSHRIKNCWLFNYIIKYILVEKIPFMTDKLTIQSKYNKDHYWKEILTNLENNKKSFELKNLKASMILSLKNENDCMINYRKI
jgi:hypothetical protein